MLRLEKRQRPVMLHKTDIYRNAVFTLLLIKHSLSVIFLEGTKTSVSFVCYLNQLWQSCIKYFSVWMVP